MKNKIYFSGDFDVIVIEGLSHIYIYFNTDMNLFDAVISWKMIGFDIYMTGIVRYFSFKLILSSMILNWYFNKFWPLYVSLSCLIAWILYYHRLRSLNRQLGSKPLHIGRNRPRGAAVAIPPRASLVLYHWRSFTVCHTVTTR